MENSESETYADGYVPVPTARPNVTGAPGAPAGPAIGAINGKLYVAGGLDGNGALTNVVEVYDPAANNWTTLAHMPAAVTNAASVALNGQLYVFGGNNGTGHVATRQRYDPHKNKWRSLLTLLPAPL